MHDELLTATAVDFQTYLEAKFDLDSASLHRPTYDLFREAFTATRSPRLLDLGTGTGAMLRRAAALEPMGRALLVGLDREEAALDRARAGLAELLTVPEFPPKAKRSAAKIVEVRTGRRREDRQVEVRLVRGNLLDRPLPEELRSGLFHFVTAHAFMDLMPPGPALRVVRSLLLPGGLFYTTLNYDGLTTLLPPDSDAGFERRLLGVYDRSMDLSRERGRRTAGRLSGRRLYAALLRSGFRSIGAGASDWSVFPGAGGYSAREKVLLRALLAMVAGEGLRAPALDPGRVRSWYGRRIAEVEAGRLALVVHQLDILAARSDGAEPG